MLHCLFGCTEGIQGAQKTFYYIVKNHGHSYLSLTRTIELFSFPLSFTLPTLQSVSARAEVIGAQEVIDQKRSTPTPTQNPLPSAAQTLCNERALFLVHKLVKPSSFHPLVSTPKFFFFFSGSS